MNNPFLIPLILAAIWVVYSICTLIAYSLSGSDQKKMERVWRIRRYQWTHPEEKLSESQEQYLKKYGHLYDNWLKGQS